MFKRPEIDDQSRQYDQLKAREEVRTTLRKLQMLRNRISELRSQCEELRKLRSENKDNTLLCSECGEAIEPGQEIVVKDSEGTQKKNYHQECFKMLWV
jgi:uncharacterized membrane protein